MSNYFYMIWKLLSSFLVFAFLISIMKQDSTFPCLNTEGKLSRTEQWMTTCREDNNKPELPKLLKKERSPDK